jgi:FAD synthase
VAGPSWSGSEVLRKGRSKRLVSHQLPITDHHVKILRCIDGKVVSSTSIRVAVQRGDLREAAGSPGRPFYRQIAHNVAWAQQMAEMERRATDAGDLIDIVFGPGARAHS